MILQRSNYFRQLLFLATILIVVAGARGGRIKGANHGRSSRRLAGKKKFHGPKHRSCTTSAKNHEVKFECRTKTNARSNADGDEPQDRGISIVPDPSLIKDKIKYKIKTENDGISVKLEYKNEIEMEDNTETETKTKFELLFYEIVEYVKKSNDDLEVETTIEREAETEESGLSKAYDWNQDEIVQSFPLTDWMDIPDIVDAEDGIVSYFTATTENLGMEGGTVAFNFTISRADMDGGESITANSMKIDVLIKDFPWSREDSYVAILSTLKSVKKIKVEYDQEATVEGGSKGKKAKDVLISFDGADTMESTFGFSTYGEYLWANEAAATGLESLGTDTSSNFTGSVMTGRKSDTDNDEGVIPGLPTTEMLAEEVEVIKNNSTTVEVVATSPDGQTEDNIQSIAYSFVGAAAQGASDIYWDPQTGIGYQSSSSSNGCIMGLVGTALVALFYSL